MKTSAPERVDLPVSGMTCAACARTIERTLTSTPGVVRVNVNLATNTATVEFDPRIVQVRDFVLAIEELGYGVPELPVKKLAGKALLGPSAERRGFLRVLRPPPDGNPCPTIIWR